MAAIIRKAMKGDGLVQLIFRSSFTNILVLLLTTVSSMVTVRMFDVDGRGELAAVLFWPGFLAGLVTFGMPTSLTYNMKRDPEQAANYVRTGFLYSLAAGALAGIVAWFWLPVWLNGYSHGIIVSAQWFTVISVPITLFGYMMVGLAQTVDRFDINNSLKLASTVINLGGLLLLWAFGWVEVYLAVIVYFISSMRNTVISIYYLREHLRLNWFKRLWDRASYRALFGYGSKVYGVEMLGTLYSQFDKLIILSLLTVRDLGLYTVIYSLSRIFNAVQNAVVNIIFPKVAALPREEVAATVGRSFRLSSILMLAILVPSLWIGKLMLGLLFGPEFRAAADTFYILSLECIVGGGALLLGASFNAIGRPGLVLVRQIIALAVTVGLFFVFIPPFGLNGIALALLAGAVIRLVFSLVSMSMLFGAPMRSILFDRGDFVYLKQEARKVLARRRSRARSGSAEHSAEA